MLINKPNTVHTTHATDTTQLPDNQRALTDQACLWTDKKRVRKGSISFICTLYFFWNLGASQWEVCSGHWSLNITVNMLKWSLKAIGKPFVVELPLPGAGYYYPTPVYFSPHPMLSFAPLLGSDAGRAPPPPCRSGRWCPPTNLGAWTQSGPAGRLFHPPLQACWAALLPQRCESKF